MSDAHKTKKQLISELAAMRRQFGELMTFQQETGQQMDQAQRRQEALGRFAGEVAHDFKNILTVIRCYTELLLDDLPTDDPMSRHLEQVMHNVYRATMLTRQLLALSRNQAPQPELLDLNVVIADMVEMLRSLVGRDINLTIYLEAKPCLIQADRGQIEQVIINLALNAYDAMPYGGQLTLQTAQVNLAEADNKRASPAQLTPLVRLTVSDTGIGMDAQTQAHIFEPFFTTKTSGGSSGLGLAQVYSAVSQQQGYIDVNSQVGQGSKFTLYLPAWPGEAL
jgi:signal transduction histidine kinase